jgi:hypothetical protein
MRVMFADEARFGRISTSTAWICALPARVWRNRHSRELCFASERFFGHTGYRFYPSGKPSTAGREYSNAAIGGGPYDSWESRLKSSSTAAISFCRRGSCAAGVAEKRFRR